MATRDESGSNLFDRVRPLLAGVKSPAWYVGGEVNEVVKDRRAVSGRVALVYPDAYPVGMSHYGLKILYHLVNLEPDLAAERAFAPWPDFAEKLRAAKLPLFSLETKTPLAQFDVVGFTIQSELTLTNVLDVLAAAGATARDVAQCSVFVADVADIAPMREVYAQYFATPPRRAGVAAAELDLGARVEIECTAVVTSAP